jgi:hypothetical protein
MRYLDGPEITVEIEIAAPVETVWGLVTDIDLPARFSNEFRGASWLDGIGAPSLGARFRGWNENERLGGWEVVCTVDDFEVGRCFGWAVGDVSAPAARWRFELERTAAGTRLRQWARMGPGPSGLTPMIAANPEREEAIVEMRLGMWRPNMEATLRGIKGLAEATS